MSLMKTSWFGSLLFGVAVVAWAEKPSDGRPAPRGEPVALDLTQRLGVMLQTDNLLDAYRAQKREKDFGAEVERQFQLVEETGARWVRAGILWNQIEREQGKYEWEHVEAVIRAANRHHIQLVWLVGGMPHWNSRGGPDGVSKQLPDPHFRQFLHHLLDRYGGRRDANHPLKGSIQCWEIINEPNYHWKPEQYAVALTEAFNVLKADGDARVVFGGLGGDVYGNQGSGTIEKNQVTYFDKVIDHLPKGTRPFHCVNFHLYGNDADHFFPGDDAVEKYFDRCQDEIRKVLKKHGLDEVPVWSTEFDYPSAVKHQVRGKYKGDAPADGLKKQALFLHDWFPKLLADQPERKVFWASLVDDFNDKGAFLSTGLCHWKSDQDRHAAGERKPAYLALKELLHGEKR